MKGLFDVLAVVRHLQPDVGTLLWIRRRPAPSLLAVLTIAPWTCCANSALSGRSLAAGPTELLLRCFARPSATSHVT